MRTVTYFDTSALAKWYLNESRSEDVEAYIRQRGPLDISDLTVVEMRCLLGRRRREGHINRGMEAKVFGVFQEDARQGFLRVHPLFSEIAAAAVNLLATLSETPLRTLDALHLALAREIRTDVLATADRVMAEAAAALGFHVVRFDPIRGRR